GARVILRVDRYVEEPVAAVEVVPEEGQLVLFEQGGDGALPALVPSLQPLPEVPAAPLHRVRRLSFSALALFERCSYRYYAERVAGLREERGTAPGGGGLKATEVGDAVHRLLEVVDLASPAPPNLDVVRTCYPAVTDE